jgi:hypothetical protein
MPLPGGPPESLRSDSSLEFTALHVVCERDVGLFSLIQQAIANIPWAIHENRTPVIYFQNKTCYWTSNGYQDKDTVWEYYFDPVFPTYPASSLPLHIRSEIARNHPCPSDVGYFADEQTFVSSHFGDHPDLKGKTLWIPYFVEDPDDGLRRQASAVIQEFVRPRAYIQEKVNRFFDAHIAGNYVIGVHVRGTDAISNDEVRWHRKGSLSLEKYVREIRRRLKVEPDARIFVATDAHASLDYLKEMFGARVIACDSLRHRTGNAAGKGPTGWIMPAYVAGDRDQAARNGEEAVIEYLLLARCKHLIHNGSSLSRTVLLTDPEMPHTNTHTRAADNSASRESVAG